MGRVGAFEIWTDEIFGSSPTLATVLPPAAAKAGRMTSPKVFAGETLLGGKGPLHTFFHGSTAGGDVAD